MQTSQEEPIDYEELCHSFITEGLVLHSGTNVLLRSLRRIHKGLFYEHNRLKFCSLKTCKIVTERHQKAVLRIFDLLKTYASNILYIETQGYKALQNYRKLSSRNYRKLLQVKKQLEDQRNLILLSIENIVISQLKILSNRFKAETDALCNGEIFKVIKIYNLFLENIKRNAEYFQEQEESYEKDTSLNTLSVPSTSRQKQPPPPVSVDKIRDSLAPDGLVSMYGRMKKFTASRILQIVGSMRCGQVTECISEALLSRLNIPDVENRKDVNFPWKPATYLFTMSSANPSNPHIDIFEEALAKEEDENQLNEKKLDLALRQEFGDDFPGTDYLPNSESNALKPISSKGMDRVIKTNTALLEILLKKFLNTHGIMVPALVKTGKYGELRLSTVGRKKLEGYYVDQIWGVGSNLVDELILWSPLIIRKVENTDNGQEVSTPSSSNSDCSTVSSNATTIAAGDLKAAVTSSKTGGIVTGKKTFMCTLNVNPKLEGSDHANFISPPALSNYYLMYLHDMLNKLIRRGVLPGWCIDSCEGLSAESSHLLTQSYLDNNLVSGFGAYAQRAPTPVQLIDGNYSTQGGVGLSEAVELLVWQINQIEKTEIEQEEKDWPISDLVEYMSVLGSVVSSALSWLKLRSDCVLHTWTTSPYYLMTQADLPHILQKFVKMNCEEREYLNKTDDLQRALMVPYREKLIIRVTKLLTLTKKQECTAVESLGSICRTVSLAHLKNAMPPASTWRGIGRLPHEPHDYVADYVGSVLQPVFDAVSQLGEQLQKRAGSAVLKVVCYAWLEHIRENKFKFSLWGAQQLLKDFSALSSWVQAYPGLCPAARTQVLNVDVLRECEGVARLLMRQPPLTVGYSALNQVAPLTTIKAGREHDKNVKLTSENDDIPPEMYVPNQIIWLNRRTRPSSSLCVKSASCCTWPY